MNYDKIISYFQENDDVFTETIEELDSWNGYLGDDRYYPMEEMNDLFCGQSVEWILCRAFFGYDEENWTINASGEKEYGPFNPCRDYFSFNGYGNFVSADYKDYSAYLDDWFIDQLLEHRNHLYLNDEVVDLLDELENDDNENDGENDD
jgi:hypothetical protein